MGKDALIKLKHDKFDADLDRSMVSIEEMKRASPFRDQL